ncbi:beta-Ig-H3/fasciclin [Nitritalea halalkaliphila LW7]|uniref:Beta-Ig-H3/fasciclin n=1 Tax=Nitritalea halalkaliphila LW7 TaxID=1189621 RepID=I5C7B0_9BACT|nr:fasciclin domain-containing protein [Nitritalea halalkaliphila]EIM77712.1 beta-Ig-H3/fasciclin [Nitritalea halalkaliphila LW7]
MNFFQKYSKFTTPALGLALAMGFTACSDEDDPIPTPPAAESNIVEIAADTPDFSTLVTAVETAGLVETLSSDGPFTVFAPTNAAFEAFLEENNLTADALLGMEGLGDVLTYHVLAGEAMAANLEAGRLNTVADAPIFVSIAENGNVWINGNTRVVQTDIDASNGVIHVLDFVLMPPSENIAEMVIAATEAETPEFTQLLAALQRADLAGAFMGGFEDDFTVFAPTDAAFMALYEALEVDGIEDIDVETLTAVLQLHVIGNTRAFSQDLRDGMEVATLGGAEITVDLTAMTVGGAPLNSDSLNMLATNGVIHVIDAVILPEMAEEEDDDMEG